MTFSAGTRLDHYEIRSLLGAGGMGEVYLAHDLKLKRTVALKVLSAEFAGDRQRMSRFTQEARIASLLSHPNTVHVYEIGKAEGVSFIAMEYVEGQSLRRMLAQSRLSVALALDVAAQVAGALAMAHAVGVIHRDIKAENIMVGRDGHVKVLDFGLAKPAPTDSPGAAGPKDSTVSQVNTSPGVVMGTVNYMSPEQARGLEVDARTDIWSLGVVLYEMLTGQTPFDGPTANDVIASILKQEPPPPTRFREGLPEALEWVVMKALVKDAEGRYQTAREFLADVQRLKQRYGTSAERESSGEGGQAHASGPAGNGDGRRATTGEARGLTSANSPVHQTSSAAYIVEGVRRHKKAAAAITLLVSLAALSLAVVAYRSFNARGRARAAQRSLTRLTFDSGLQCNPTWSPDGRFIAYSSDHKGNFDIWVQQADGGTPIQVTNSPAHDWQPDWSPDGKNIVFRSERDGGGLYVVPAFGGVERRVSSFGYMPKWSPNGSQILFLSAGQRIYDFPKLYVIELSDSRPREIKTLLGDNKEEGVRQGSVAWHPDGRRISFLTMDGTFWTVPSDGGQPLKSELSAEVDAEIKRAGISLGNFRWEPSGRALYFEGWARGVLNLWRISVDPATLRWVDGPERLTTGYEQDTDIAISPDGKRLAFTTVTQSTRVWLLPFDSRAGKITGQGQPVTPPDADAWFLDLSRDGKRLIYSTQKYGMGKPELWEKSLEDGGQVQLAADGYYRFFPRWSPDATRLAYSRFQPVNPDASSNPPKGTEKTGPVALFDRRNNQEQFLTSPGPWLDYAGDWSPDGRYILASTNRNSPDRWEVCAFPVSAAPHAETEMRVVASDPENSLWSARFSPDGRWVSYIAQKVTSADTSVVYVVPSSGGTPVRVTAPDSWADWPRWSPDGRTIYFVAGINSSFLNVWGIRFNPVEGKPLGEPFRVSGYDSPSHMISVQLARTEMALTANRLAIPILDISGSVWMLEDVDR